MKSPRLIGLAPQAEDHTYHIVESLVRLFPRRGFDWIERYPAIAATAAKLFDDGGGRGGDGLGRTQSSLRSALRSMPARIQEGAVRNVVGICAAGLRAN